MPFDIPQLNLDELQLLMDALQTFMDRPDLEQGRFNEAQDLADKIAEASRTAVANADYDCGFRDRFTLANTTRMGD